MRYSPCDFFFFTPTSLHPPAFFYSSWSPLLQMTRWGYNERRCLPVGCLAQFGSWIGPSACLAKPGLGQQYWGWGGFFFGNPQPNLIYNGFSVHQILQTLQKWNPWGNYFHPTCSPKRTRFPMRFRIVFLFPSIPPSQGRRNGRYGPWRPTDICQVIGGQH